LERWRQLPHRILTILRHHNETPITANDNALRPVIVFLLVVQYRGKAVFRSTKWCRDHFAALRLGKVHPQSWGGRYRHCDDQDGSQSEDRQGAPVNDLADYIH
jgi:hypothetical protein